MLKKYKAPIPPIPPKVFRDPLYFFVFGFGSGAMPIAPGTFGTLMAIPFYLLLSTLPLFSYLLITLIFIAFASYASGKVSREIGVHDHQGMCIDEFAGFFVTMIHAPKGIFWIILGFILFRIFDIFKPWPIRTVDETWHGGFGMIFDDVLAGVYACLIIQGIALIVGW